MKIRYAIATGCPAGQFVVYAENEEEQAILNNFIFFPDYAKDEWIFWKHGSTHDSGRITSFNFGYIKKKVEVE